MRIFSVMTGENCSSASLPDTQCLSGNRESSQAVRETAKPSWNSFLLEDKVDADFMLERVDVIDEGRCLL